MGDLVPLRRVAGAVGELSDEALVSAAGSGDRAALGALFDRFSADVFRFVARIAGSFAADLDDLLQATFLEVYRSSARFDRRSSVKTWIFGIAVNIVRHHRRGEGRRNAALQRYASVGVEPDRGIDAALDRTRQLERLSRALDDLAEPLRVAYVLCVIEELTAREAATALGASEGTVWRRVSEARAALRKLLDGGAA
jgi:RNA polymerase sigma-70 factor, ECF subfamily